MTNNKTTLVIGAVANEERYAFKAVHMLQQHGFEVLPFGQRKGNIGGLEIETEKFPEEGIDTVTLYINPSIQQQYKEAIVKLKPRRVIFNPGTENPDFEQELSALGIEASEACTLVLLSTGQF
jgi:hypothetical protein